MLKAKTWRGTRRRYAHAKMDGIRLEVNNGRATTKLTDLTDKLKSSGPVERAICSGLHLDCELWCPGVRASSIITLVNEQPERLHLGVFSLVNWRDDISLEDVHEAVHDCGLTFLPYWTAEEFDWEAKTPLTRIGDVRPHDLEGWVFKDGNRTSWEKWKYERTIDLVITGFSDGKGKNEGFVGAMLCSTSEGHEVANVSGMDDEVRYGLTDSDIGRVVEVRYQYVGDGGRLRHPRFLRWRDDKQADECKLDQDSDLERFYSTATPGN